MRPFGAVGPFSAALVVAMPLLAISLLSTIAFHTMDVAAFPTPRTNGFSSSGAISEQSGATADSAGLGPIGDADADKASASMGSAGALLSSNVAVVGDNAPGVQSGTADTASQATDDNDSDSSSSEFGDDEGDEAWSDWDDEEEVAGQRANDGTASTAALATVDRYIEPSEESYDAIADGLGLGQ